MSEVSEQVARHMQHGARMYEQNDPVNAQRSFALALALEPNLPGARFNLAVTCRDLEQNDDAEILFRQLSSDPQFAADATNNLGILASRREQWERAENCFRAAIAHRNQFPLAHFNLATLLLRRGQMTEGWQEYEWRWQTPTFTPLNCPHPQWDGSQLDGTLLLHTEQGAGDTFQFARYIPEVRRRCRKVLFVRPNALACMFPKEKWADEMISPGSISLDSFDAVLPLMSAPFVLGDEFKTPRDIPYLTPVERAVDLGDCHVDDAKLKVGFAWAGSPTHSNDAFRSTLLKQFAPLLRIPGVAFYSLQKGPQTAELAELEDLAGAVRDLDPLQADFADTAAMMRQLDLVITVDTSVLHLAGGLGIPVWGLISRRSDWRWRDDQQTDSDWYPTLTLFRQSKLNDWPELMNRVVEALVRLRDDQE